MVSAKKKSILIVDDEAENRSYLARVFAKDFEIFEASNGAEAIIIARNKHPDVVIADQRMPKIRGVDLLSQIRKELPHTIRILATAYTDHEALMDAVNQAGIHHYFEKPVHTVDLKSVVTILASSANLESEYLRLDVAWQESEALRASVFQVSTQPLLVCDPRGVVEELNQALESVMGLSRTQIEGKILTELFESDGLVDHFSSPQKGPKLFTGKLNASLEENRAISFRLLPVELHRGVYHVCAITSA